MDRAAASRIAHGDLTLYNPLSNADLDEASRQYDAFVSRIVAPFSKDKIVAGRSPITDR